jgi:large subunit ribosomal protein L23
MIEAEKILIKNLVTEKSTIAASHENKYTFKVSPKANATAVKQAVESAFDGIDVVKVNIMNVKPKAKRSRTKRGVVGYKSGYKKAIVTLKAGQTLDLV